MDQGDTQTTVVSELINRARDHYRIILGMLAFGLVPQILHFVAAIGPPWPGNFEVALFTSIASTIGLISFFLRWENLGVERLRRKGLAAQRVALGALLVYVAVATFFIYEGGQRLHTVAGGWELLPDVKVILETHPDLNEQDLLDAAQWEATKVWPPLSVRTVRLVLLLSWIMLWFSLAALTTLFVIRREGQRRRPRRPAMEES